MLASLLASASVVVVAGVAVGRPCELLLLLELLDLPAGTQDRLFGAL